jgi:hypothetical protein
MARSQYLPGHSRKPVLEFRDHLNTGQVHAASVVTCQNQRSCTPGHFAGIWRTEIPRRPDIESLSLDTGHRACCALQTGKAVMQTQKTSLQGYVV